MRPFSFFLVQRDLCRDDLDFNCINKINWHSNTMHDSDDVLNAFKWILGREPESGLNIDDLRSLSSDELRDRILSSKEFEEMYRNRYLSIFRFFFLRIPKAATTATYRAFERAGLRSLEVSREFPDLSEAYSSFSLISGHVTYNEVIPRLFGLRPIFLALVREPEQRAISLYAQARREAQHPCHDEVAERTLYQALDLGGIFFEWVFNNQCRFLTGRHLFEDVRAILCSDYYIVAPVRNANRLVAAVCRLTGAPLVEVVPDNVGDKKVVETARAQPDFERACTVLKWILTEDRKLMEHVGEFYISPGLLQILPKSLRGAI